MKIAATVFLAIGAVLLLAAPVHAQDSKDHCPAELKTLQSDVKTTASGVRTMPSLSSSQIEKQIKVMEDCRWNNSGATGGGQDESEPYAEMRDQLADVLLGRYRTFLVNHNLMAQLEREEAKSR